MDRWARKLLLRLRALLRRSELDQELDEELQIHIEQLTAQGVAAGKSQEEARYAALQAMGGLTQRKEECRDTRKVRWMQDIAQDAGYAMRTLKGKPAFTLIAALVLALGIGANTAVFTVVKSVLLQPLPYDQSDRLMLIAAAPKNTFFDMGFTMLDSQYLQFRRQNHSFESLAALGSIAGRKMTLTRHGDPIVLDGCHVGPDLMHLLRVTPQFGRPFLRDGSADPNVALLSHATWVKRFGGDPKAIGQEMTLDGVGYTIVGVMPESFHFENADVWIRNEVRLETGNVFFIPVVGRLKDGVTRTEALAELTAFTAHLPKDGFGRDGYLPRVLPLRDLFVADVRKQLLIFSGAVGLVFLIACANFANLLLIRGAGRQPELAVRAALGASRWRLVRQLLTESVLLALGGAVLGLVFSKLGTSILLSFLPAESTPFGREFGIDQGVLAFTLALSLLTGIVFGLVPAWQATQREVREGVNEGGRGVLTRRERVRGALVMAEVALALMLLTGAGLLVRSFLRMRDVNPGFQTAGISLATVDLPDARYKTAAQMKDFDDQVMARLAAIPGGPQVAAVSFPPFGYGVIGDFQLADGRHLPEGFQVVKPEVSSDYFRTMGIRIVQGRGFTDRDNASAPGVVVFSETVARRLWPAGNAVGQRISMDDHPTKDSDWLTIVGVAADVRQQGFSDTGGLVVYQPYRQITMPGFINHMSFVVRSSNLRAAQNGLRAAIRAADPDLPTDSITSMDAVLSSAMMGARSQARLLSCFATMALLIAAIGIYGVLASSVAERTHEIGIRMAVGAQRAHILGMVMVRTLGLTLFGIVLGAVGAIGLTGVLSKYLFEVKPTDPLTFCLGAGVLTMVALLAAWTPARRAMAIDPQAALRHE